MILVIRFHFMLAPFIWESRRHRVLMLFSIMHHLLYSARIIQRLRGKTFHVWNPGIGDFDSLWIMGFPGVNAQAVLPRASLLSFHRLRKAAPICAEFADLIGGSNSP
jgi:hypothetical protein